MQRSDFTRIIKKLEKRFETKKEDDDSHLAYEIWLNGKYITRVKNSHSSSDYIDNLIAKNLHISKTHLRQFIACTFSNEDLIEKMKERGIS